MNIVKKEPLVLQDAVEKLIAQDPEEKLSWLQELLNRTEESEAPLLLEKLKEKKLTNLQQVIARAKQLEKIESGSFEKEPVKTLFHLKVALVMQTQLSKTEKAFYEATQTGLPWDIQTDEGKNIYLLARADHSSFKASGGSKDVLHAQVFDQTNLEALPSVCVYSLPNRKRSKEIQVTEMQTLEKLQGPHVVELRTWVETAEGVSAVFKKYNQDLYSYVKAQQSFLKGERGRNTLVDTRFLLNRQIGFKFEAQLACALKCLEAVSFLHKAGYVHGDIKLDNYLVAVNKEGKMENIVLADLEMTTSQLAESRFCGTLFAPEQLQMTPFAGDARKQDLFSLGATLYSLATGDNVPWSRYKGMTKEEHHVQTLKAIEQVRYALRDHALRDGCHEKTYYCQLIAKMLEPDPAKRDSAETLLKEMRLVQDSSFLGGIKLVFSTFLGMNWKEYQDPATDLPARKSAKT